MSVNDRDNDGIFMLSLISGDKNSIFHSRETRSQFTAISNLSRVLRVCVVQKPVGTLNVRQQI